MEGLLVRCEASSVCFSVFCGACIEAILAEGHNGNAEGGSHSNGDCHDPTQRWIMEMCLPVLSRRPCVAAFFLRGFCVAVKLSALEITCQNLY